MERMVITAYARVVDAIRKNITSGVYPVGSRLPTQKELTGIHGVGSATVSHAVRILKQEGLLHVSNRGVVIVQNMQGSATK